MCTFEILYQLFPFRKRSLARNRHSLDAILPIVLCNMLCMQNADGINDALPAWHILLDGQAKPFKRRPYVHHLVQLLLLIVTISPSFSQRINQQLVGTVRLDRVIVIQTQPPLGDKPFHAPGTQQRVKQVCKPSAVQAIRRSRQS